MELSAKQAQIYLSEHGIATSCLINWIKGGLVDGWQDVSKRWYIKSEVLDIAMLNGNIPPKAGKSPRYTKRDKLEMKRLRETGRTLFSIANQFGCDESYVSLVIRNLR